MSNEAPHLNDMPDAVRFVALKTATDPKIQNQRADEIRRQVIDELERSVTPTMTAGDLRTTHAQILAVKAAARPKRAAPVGQ